MVKGIESLVVTHVANEAQVFMRDTVKNEEEFRKFIGTRIPENFTHSKQIESVILKQFPISKYKSQWDRRADFYQYTIFTCNNRWLTEAYEGKIYSAQYSKSPGLHATDLITTFYNSGGMLGLVLGLLDSSFASFAAKYQSYFASYAQTGDVNKFRADGTIEWPFAVIGPSIGKTLNMTDFGFELIEDSKTRAQDCDMWRDVYATLTNVLGEFLN
jgi:hypothetical protein